jgi:hypothetical protein
MAAILLGYFTTMVATLFALMMLLNTVLSSGMTERVHHRPYPYPAVAQASALDNKQAAATDKQTGQQTGSSESESVIGHKGTTLQMASVAPARLAAAKPRLPDRNQRQKSALNQTHKENAAGRRQDQEYSLALGYAQEPQRQAGGPLFDLFGPRRF